MLDMDDTTQAWVTALIVVGIFVAAAVKIRSCKLRTAERPRSINNSGASVPFLDPADGLRSVASTSSLAERPITATPVRAGTQAADTQDDDDAQTDCSSVTI